MKYYTHNDSMIGRQVATEYILVPIRQRTADMECIYVLDEVGQFIWELMKTPVSIDSIVASLVKEYDVDSKKAKDDIIEFIDQMKEIEAVTEETKES